jgi:peptidoglycan/xylan/chitin deacetylase (PgdA/CDA1 family)
VLAAADNRIVDRLPPLVLAYHVVGEVSRHLDPHNLAIGPELLRRHVELLRARGYRFATVTGLARELASGRPARGLCALSFDDGSEDGLTVLPQLLGALGAPATLFVCPGLLGQPHPFMAPAAGVRLMSAAQLRELAGIEGFELGAHTMRHTVLAQASGEQAMAEMASCKAALEQLTGRRVTSFAYPEGFYSAACPDAARRAGYETAVACGPRGSLQPFELRRVAVNRLDGRLSFELKVRGLYDPLWHSGAGRVGRWLARPVRHGRLSRAAQAARTAADARS